MARRELLAEAHTPDAERLTLTLEGGEHVVRVRGELLMSSRRSGSEQAMAGLALADGAAAAQLRVLVGGLGMGFTLRAVLDRLGPRAQVDVLELLAEVVHWNRGPLGGYADRPLDDPRVQLFVADLLDHLTSNRPAYDAILLDIDNGPEAFTVSTNARLYAPTGLAALHDALRPRGVMVLWSAFRSRRFEQRLRKVGFAARSVTVRARGSLGKGTRHTLFVGVRQ